MYFILEANFRSPPYNFELDYTAIRLVTKVNIYNDP